MFIISYHLSLHSTTGCLNGLGLIDESMIFIGLMSQPLQYQLVYQIHLAYPQSKSQLNGKHAESLISFSRDWAKLQFL
jgi:hypothetical protein